MRARKAPPATAALALSRLVYLLRPSRVLLRQLMRNVRPNGPLSVVLVLFTMVAAAVAAIRQRIVHHVRACSCCRGYGLQRCTLCRGMGVIGWEGKWEHREPCPMCLGRRHVDCVACGGRFHRPLFRHCRTTAQSLLEQYEAYDIEAGLVMEGD